MAKARELRELSDEQLSHELAETQKELFDIRMRSATERNDAPANVRRLRRDIARLKTIQNERTKAAGQGVEA